MAKTPFEGPWLMVADTLRVYCCLAGIGVCAYVGAFLLSHRRAWSVWCAALALAALAASAIGTTVTYLLFTNVVGVTLGLVGMWQLRRVTEE